MATEHHFYADNLVDVLLEEGVPAECIWELDGWKVNEQGYYWTDVHTEQHHGYDGVANGHLFHHTASTGYTPYVKSNGKTKANVWAGMRRGDRLYQDGGGIPTLAIASAGPADYSSGSGVRQYVKDISVGIKEGRQRSSDDNPEWYGNRYLWNTEVICDGIGGAVAEDLWNLLPLYGAALSRLHDTNEFWNGFHQGFTGRKIDYRDGRYTDAEQTLLALWDGIAIRLGEDTMGLWIEDWTDESWMTWFDNTKIPGVSGNGRYYCKNDGTYKFDPPWGEGPVDNNGNQMDGAANTAAKVNAINHVFSGLAMAVDVLAKEQQ